MSLSFEAILAVLLILISVDIILVFILIINKAKKKGRKKYFEEQKGRLLEVLLGSSRGVKKEKMFDAYFLMRQSILLNETKSRSFQRSILVKVKKKYEKGLYSKKKLVRMETAVQMGILASESDRTSLETAILNENDFSVKIYIANALADIGDKRSIPALVASLIASHRWYRDKVNMLITDFGEDFHAYLPNIIEREEIEIKELIVDFSAVYISEYLKTYLLNLVNKREETLLRIENIFKNTYQRHCDTCVFGMTRMPNDDRVCRWEGVVRSDYGCRKYKKLPVSTQSILNYKKLMYKAAGVMAQFYYKELSNEEYLNCEDSELRNMAVKALSNNNSNDNFNKLVFYLKDDMTAKTASGSILQVVERNPGYINTVLNLFTDETDPKMRTKYAEILSGRIEYFIMKLSSNDKSKAAEVIKQVLSLGKTNEIIGFLNINKDKDIENELVAIIKEALIGNDLLEKELCTYLNERIITKCGLLKCEDILKKKTGEKNPGIIRLLYSIMFIILLIFPIIYILRHIDIVFIESLFQQIKTYVLDFNYYLIFYSAAINLIYILLLIMSFFNVSKQIKLWDLKGISLLFKKRMLPSISIIAPAHNEEKIIIENANSLLNLEYPDYELIIVNDGSTDATLEVLIQNFELIRVDYTFEYKLKTMPIRGIYMNRSMPKLIVVDKENGGKADSLNAGINISSKEYLCGIDADSLLEEGALLKLASQTLDVGVETPALGGNIFPINGCKVDCGLITDINVPRNMLARFQNIEYIRAFMAGRMGWDYINCLLIISGAFGLFRKERIIGIGGYLTSSGKYGKDTVGEDMELVVRISRLMCEQKLKYRICYSFNANCWTEVPEDLGSLKKQRYRWQRGLIEILTFHKKVLFNPRYGRMGIVAMPYFLIFEMLGPLIEIQGYVMVLLAFFLGLLNLKIAIMLFVSTVLLGVLVSVASVLIAEKDLGYFKYRDIFILLLYAVLENFGPRQLVSFWRVVGFFKMLGKSQGWGKIERKGFAGKKAEATG